MNNLKGATKTGLILVSAIALVLVLSVLVEYGQSAFGGGFVVSNVTPYNGVQTNIIIGTTNAGQNTTFIESGAQNVTVNISLKVLDGGPTVVNGINITLPRGFSLRSEIGNFSLNTSTLNVSSGNTSNIRVFNETASAGGFSGLTNISYTNASNFGDDGKYVWNGSLLNTSGNGWFAFWINVPTARALGNLSGVSGNNTFNITITTTYNTTHFGNNFNLTVYINDTIAPTNLTVATPTRANNTNTTNTTLDFMAVFNETNAEFVNLTVGFGNNGSIVNKSMAIINPSASSRSSVGNATVSVAGLPDGKHNFTFYVTDKDNNQASNTTPYFITTDATTPSLTLTTPSANVVKSATVTSSDLSCSATDATSGVASTTNQLTITTPTGRSVTHTCGNSFTDTSEVGTYSVSFTQNDMAGNSATKTGTFLVQFPSNQPTSSQSSPVSAPTVLATTTLTVSTPLTSSKPADLTVPADVAAKASVQKIQVEVSKDVAAADATVVVSALQAIPTTDDKGQTLTALPSDQQPVLKVVQIKPSATLSSAVSKATITFTLTKTELGTTDPSKIVLARFADGKWNELPTTPGSAKADGSVDFTAITPGFSVFVVTTKAPSATPAASPTPKTQPSETTAPTATASSSPKTTPAGGGLDTTILLSIVVVIIIIVVVVLVLMKRGK